MKLSLLALAACLALPVTGHAEIVTRTVEAEVRSVVTTNGPSSVDAVFQPGHRFTLTVEYNTVLPEGAAPGVVLGHTGYYWMLGYWSLQDGGALGIDVGFAFINFTNDHPSWDAVGFSSSPTETFGRLGDSIMSGAAVVLSDAGGSALSSTDLVALPGLSDFSSGEFTLAFTDVFAFLDPTPTTLVSGRILAIDNDPARPAFQCQGFGAPLHGPVQVKRGSRRPLLLRGSLIAGNGAAVGPETILSRPIVRVLQTSGSSGMRYLSLDGEDGSFSYRNGQWQYTLRASSLPETGTYLVSMTTPDQNQYVLEPQCGTTVVVSGR